VSKGRRGGLVGLAAAGCVLLGLVGCGAATPTDTAVGPTGAPAATQAANNQLACTAMGLASQGQWAQAETHWLSAEEHAATGNYAAAMAYYLLVTDSGTIATDQLTGAPQAADVATYNRDLAGDGAYTAGC
jgi:hypothetical protein